jgi:hypothetical protein
MERERRRDDEEEDLTSYCMPLRKGEDGGN